MGNLASYFRSKEAFEEYIGTINSHFTSSPRHLSYFDPRSPSVGINRTPIVVDNGHEDPRSPSFEIIHTPIYSAQKKLSNIEEDQTVKNEECLSVKAEESVLIPTEEIINFPSLVMASSSSPAPSPIKPLKSKLRRVDSNIVVDENSFSKKSISVENPLRPRVLLGDLNNRKRSSLATPRLYNQNKF